MKNLFITVLTIGCTTFVQAQDFHYSLFQMSPMTLNPGMIGNFTGDLRVVSNYRTQWSSISDPYKTITASVEMPLNGTDGRKRDYFTLALNFNTDKAGAFQLKTTQYNAGFSYNKSFDGAGQNNFTVGFLTGATQRSIALSGVRWDSQFNGLVYDPSLSSGEATAFGESYYHLDLSTGIAYTSASNKRFRFALGAGMWHVARPRVAFLGNSDRMYRKAVAHASCQIALGENSNAYFVPAVQYVRQGPSQTINVNGGIKYELQDRSRYTGYQESKSFTLGGAYRVGDAASAYLRLDVGRFATAFTYDFNLSGLTLATQGRGAMEVMLVYNGIWKSKNTRLSNSSFF